jgi:hypothetical protein
MALISLVYVSVASHDMTDDDLKEILKEARDFNEPNNVTGMLLYRDGFFIQALEGEAEVVEPLYERIAEDPRHAKVLIVHKTEIDERSFSDWSMGFNKITDEAANQVEGFTSFLQNPGDMSFFTDHPSRATFLLDAFKSKIYF